MRRGTFWLIWCVAFGGLNLVQAVLHFGANPLFVFYVINTLAMWYLGTWWLHHPIDRIP